MDTVLTKRLIEVLHKETDIFKGILKLSKNKTDTIVEGKVSELESITRLEQSMILQLGKLEEEREELVDKLAVQLNVEASDLTLTGLEKLLPKEEAEQLRDCRKMLPELLHEVDETNVLNSKLIRNSLDYIDFSVNILTNAGTTGSTYGNSGRSSDSKKRNFLDMRL